MKDWADQKVEKILKSCYRTDTVWPRGFLDPFTDALREEREQNAKRIEAYAVSLEIQRHIGLPDPVAALQEAANKVRAEPRDT